MKINDLKNAADFFDYSSETGVILNRRTGKQAGYVNDRGYVVVEFRGKRYKAHRIAWTIFHGEIPAAEIDHIDQNKQNNRISNLRVVDGQTNRKNRNVQRNNTSGVMGVCFHVRMNKWIARIKVDGSYVWLGQFDTKQEAVDVRKIAEDVYGFHNNHNHFQK